MSIRNKLSDWYAGRAPVVERERGAIWVLDDSLTDRHWTSKVANKLVEFWLDHWKWTIGTTLAVVALFVAACS